VWVFNSFLRAHSQGLGDMKIEAVFFLLVFSGGSLQRNLSSNILPTLLKLLGAISLPIILCLGVLCWHMEHYIEQCSFMGDSRRGATGTRGATRCGGCRGSGRGVHIPGEHVLHKAHNIGLVQWAGVVLMCEPLKLFHLTDLILVSNQ